MLNTFTKLLSTQKDEIDRQSNLPAEFNQRDILALKAVPNWTAKEMDIQKANNRLLQKGYGELTADQNISLAKATHTEWLTDFVCPNASNACKLNIAADLITTFKVSSEDLNNKVQEVYIKITSDSEFINNIEDALHLTMSASGTTAQIEANALETMSNKKNAQGLKLYTLPFEQETLNHFIALEHERFKKNATHTIVKDKLAPLYRDIAAALQLEYKPVYPCGENVDYSILGAAGSGKSTLSQELIKDKTNYIVLATDDYRAVVLNEENEKPETDQVFARTQDSAYCIKDLVQNRLELSNDNRANIILDCVSLEGWHRKLLANNKKTFSAVACLNDISVVPNRAYLRALDTQSGPADKGRQVNTTSLLEGHASASARLLTSIPSNVKTDLYDTNIPKGSKPPIIASVNTAKEKHEVEIMNLNRLATFLAKTNVNKDATKKVDLYYDAQKERYRYTYDSQYCAEQVLKLIPASQPFKPKGYDLILKSKKDNQPYLKILTNKENEIQIEILNDKIFNEILSKSDKGETRILKNILMQIHYGSLKRVRDVLATHSGNRDMTYKIAREALEFKELDKFFEAVSQHYLHCFRVQSKVASQLSLEKHTQKDQSLQPMRTSLRAC